MILGVPATPPGAENYIYGDGGPLRERCPGRRRSTRCGWTAQEVRSSLGEQPAGNAVRIDHARRGDSAARVKRDPRSARSARGTLPAGSSLGEMWVRSAGSRRVARRDGRPGGSPCGPRSARSGRDAERVGSSLDEGRSGNRAPWRGALARGEWRVYRTTFECGPGEVAYVPPRPTGVPVEAIEARGDIDVDDVPGPEHHVGPRDPVTHHLVAAGADRGREPLVPELAGRAAATRGVLNRADRRRTRPGWTFQAPRRWWLRRSTATRRRAAHLAWSCRSSGARTPRGAHWKRARGA